MDKVNRAYLARRLSKRSTVTLDGVDLVGVDDALDVVSDFLTDRLYIECEKIIALAEASELTGVPLSTLASRTYRGTPGWPAPIKTLRCGPLFDRDAVAASKVDPRGRRARSHDGRTVTA